MSNAGSMGSILCWGARIPQATISTEHFKNKNKETEGRRERNAQRDIRGKWQEDTDGEGDGGRDTGRPSPQQSRAEGSRHPGWTLQRTTPQGACAQIGESVASRVPKHPAPVGLRIQVWGHHCRSLAVCPGTSAFTSLGLSFFLCQMGLLRGLADPLGDVEHSFRLGNREGLPGAGTQQVLLKQPGISINSLITIVISRPSKHQAAKRRPPHPQSGRSPQTPPQLGHASSLQERPRHPHGCSHPFPTARTPRPRPEFQGQ